MGDPPYEGPCDRLAQDTKNLKGLSEVDMLAWANLGGEGCDELRDAICQLADDESDNEAGPVTTAASISRAGSYSRPDGHLAYTVKEGDTLTDLAVRFGVMVGHLCACMK